MDDRFNTIAGWTLAAGIVALGLSSLSGKIFHADDPESPEEPGYFIDAPEEEAGEAGPTLAQALAATDAAAGESVFAKCTACHSIEQGGANGIGPNLWAIIGKPIGQHAAGFAYSTALSGHGGVWDYENMDAWLKSPRAFANGTKMSFAGLSNIEDRAAIILYMREMGGGPPLPEPEAVEEPGGEDGEADPSADVGESGAASTEMEEAGGAAAEVPTTDAASTNEVGT